MIDTMFQADIDRNLNDQVQRPSTIPPTQPGFKVSGLLKGIPEGIGAAGAEIGAHVAEISGAFGQVLGQTGFSSGGMFAGQTPEEERQTNEARAKLLAEGVEMSNPQADQLRAKAKDMMPDPKTAHVSEQVVAGLANFATKAVGYSLTAGPLAPLALGSDVGLTEADRLKQEGVDAGTRTAAGAVAGVLGGASIIAPMSGASALTRFGKGVAIGEGTVIGQTAAEKAILKAAGYDKLADTFDPLDPVNLALGVVPGALGAVFGHAAPPKRTPAATPITGMGLAERQALPYNSPALDAYAVQAAKNAGIPPEVMLAVKNAGEKSGSKATSPAGARGVMQFMPETFAEFGRGDITDPINSMDAGARYLKSLHDRYGSWDAAIAHYNGGGKAAADVLAGKAPNPETAAYLARVRQYIGGTAEDHVRAAVTENPELVDAVRVSQVNEAMDRSRLTDDADLAGRDAHQEALETAFDQIGRGDAVAVEHIVQVPANNMPSIRIDRQMEHGQLFSILNRDGEFIGSGHTVETSKQVQIHNIGIDVPEARGKGLGVEAYQSLIKYALDQGKTFVSDAEVSADAQRIYASLERRGYTVERNPKAVMDDDGKLSSNGWGVFRITAAPPEATARPIQTAKAVAELLAARALKKPAPATAHIAEPSETATGAKTLPTTQAAEGRSTDEPAKGHEEPGQSPPLPQAAIDRAAAEVATLNPDMLVMLDGMTEPARVGDLLESIRASAADEKEGAKLVQAAANCLLRS